MVRLPSCEVEKPARRVLRTRRFAPHVISAQRLAEFIICVTRQDITAINGSISADSAHCRSLKGKQSSPNCEAESYKTISREKHHKMSELCASDVICARRLSIQKLDVPYMAYASQDIVAIQPPPTRLCPTVW